MADALRTPRVLARGTVLAVSLVACAWGAQWLVAQDVLSERWIDLAVAGHGAEGALAFLAVGAAATALGIPRQVVAFLGGYAFGVVAGGVLALVATLAGCALTFGYARAFAPALAGGRLRTRVRRFEAFLAAAPLQMTLIVRLLPVGSNVLTNLVAGLTRVRFAPFAAGSAAGYGPQTLAFAVAGSGIHVAPVVHAALAVVLLVASAALGLRLYRAHRRGTALEADIDRALDGGAAPPPPAAP